LHLEEKGFKVWFSPKDIITGDIIVREIQENISKCTFLAVLITRQSLLSGWVEKEWQIAIYEQLQGAKKIILPLMADEECQLPLFLKNYRYADFTQGIEVGIKTLIGHIDQHLDRLNVTDHSNNKGLVADEGKQLSRRSLEMIESENLEIKSSIQNYLKTQFVLSLIENEYFIQTTKKQLRELAKRIDADCLRVFFQIRSRLIIGLMEAEYNPIPLKPALLLPPDRGLIGWVLSNKEMAYFPRHDSDKWSGIYCDSDKRIVAEIHSNYLIF